MASNKPNPDWWTETLKDLILHDQIWYNAIRVLVSVESRSGSRVADVALDWLIREVSGDWGSHTADTPLLPKSHRIGRLLSQTKHLEELSSGVYQAETTAGSIEGSLEVIAWVLRPCGANCTSKSLLFEKGQEFTQKS